MIPLYRKIAIQIDITNVCALSCTHCNRLAGYHKKPYFMDLKTVAKAIRSLEGFPGNIGIMGGEPTMHPDFAQICKLVQKMVPLPKRQLATMGHGWDKYKKIIFETFDPENVQYNNHATEGEVFHQPVLVAAEEIIKDKALMWRLIGNCWMQWRWCGVITPKGGFMCEAAGAIDMLFDGPGGYPLEKGWWNRETEQFVDQVKRYCPRCSVAIPFSKYDCRSGHDLISKGNAKKLFKMGSPKYLDGKTIVFDKKLTEKDIARIVKKGWAPWHFRGFVQHKPEEKIESIKWEGKCDGCDGCGDEKK